MKILIYLGEEEGVSKKRRSSLQNWVIEVPFRQKMQFSHWARGQGEKGRCEEEVSVVILYCKGLEYSSGNIQQALKHINLKIGIVWQAVLSTLVTMLFPVPHALATTPPRDSI